MKVLLVGEFSSLHKYLKEGLCELGIETVLAANGDGWKKIGGNDTILFKDSHEGIKRYYDLYLNAYQKSKKFRGYDVVQLIKLCPYSKIINNIIIRELAKKNKCMALVAAGEDAALVNSYYSGKFDYYIFDFDKSTLEKYSEKNVKGKKAVNLEKKLINYMDIIIPSVYEYTLGYENTNKLAEVIPFPINSNDIDYHENKLENKVVFFHGLNRELAKGTPFIRKALEKLQQTYPHEVEVIIEGHMPFDKYLEVMNRANVVIDQCCSYGYGINACIAMAQGKVVMTGKRKETLDAININDAPMFHAQPDVEQLFRQMQYIVEHRSSIPQWGYESRKYVENVHDHVKVAQRYVDAWKSTGKI